MQKLKLYTDSFFDELRQKEDPLADKAVLFLIQSPKHVSVINGWKMIPEAFPDDFPEELKDFFQFYLDKAQGADKNLLARAQAFFEKRGDLYLAMLGFYSLPYCYAFADGAEVLVRSNRIVDQIGERLGETSAFVMEIFKPGAFFESREAYLVCAKVRLIHAFSRFFIRRYAQDWDDSFGKPVNQEDMLGTNLAFSFIVLRGLTKMGFAPTERQQADVLCYWKWVGELMGIDVTFWPDTPKEAIELDRHIRKRHLKSSAAGKKLIRSLISFYEEAIPEPIIQTQVQGILRFFLGKEPADVLGLEKGISYSGDILGLMFTFLGWKNYGGQKGYSSIRRNLEKQQKERFGQVLKISLPELKRT
ncbi:oxygenase MpaB family protein [Algoriphagus sp. oki45]|uniref:oxygenase MpaB family protein n=1 Tax=Algoriphagus sp. oki45 TaxID=3067294 RepID=UPI0027E83418|nr:oxygenase MpaB family protein [Algoriphagus sp. oki45]